VLGAGGHLHVAGYALLRAGSRAGAVEALAAARAAGATTSLDPSSAALLRGDPFAGLRFDLVRANLDELRALTGADDPRGLLSLAGEVVVTLGPDGAVWTDGEREERAPAVPATVVDTVGAGDAFVAGLLAARASGAAPRESLAAGCAAAARAVARAGGRPT
jgi:sugar/nucleoside kinase (ribokinase family)